MNALSNVGRYLFALPFGVFGILHFINAGAMAAYVPIPGGAFWVYLTGVVHLIACISIIIEQKTRLACLALGIMLLIFVLSIHLPGLIGENMQASLNPFLKDIALAGGAFFIAGHYSDVTEEIE